MKKRSMVAIVIALVMAISTLSVLAASNSVPENVTARFSVAETNQSGNVFSMMSEDGRLTINISDSTLVYFEDYVPLSDECDGLTRDAREVLFGRTLAEVLDGRNLRVVFGANSSTEPISITILFETAVPLANASEVEPVYVPGLEDAGIMAITDEIDEDAVSTGTNYNPGTGRA